MSRLGSRRRWIADQRCIKQSIIDWSYVSACLSLPRRQSRIHWLWNLKIIIIINNLNFIKGRYYQGGRKQIFYGGATVNSEKRIFKNSQNLLNKSPKDGGADAPPPCPPSSALLLFRKPQFGHNVPPWWRCDPKGQDFPFCTFQIKGQKS